MGYIIERMQLLFEPGATNDTLRISVSVLPLDEEQSNRQMAQAFSGLNSMLCRTGV
jgi:hypothetical protein